MCVVDEMKISIFIYGGGMGGVIVGVGTTGVAFSMDDGYFVGILFDLCTCRNLRYIFFVFENEIDP